MKNKTIVYMIQGATEKGKFVCTSKYSPYYLEILELFVKEYPRFKGKCWLQSQTAEISQYDCGQDVSYITGILDWKNVFSYPSLEAIKNEIKGVKILDVREA